MADKPKHIGMIAHIDAGKTTLTAAISRIVAQSAIPPVDGLEVVALDLAKRIEREFYHDQAGGAVQTRAKVQVIIAEALSQASSVIAGLTAERDAAQASAFVWENRFVLMDGAYNREFSRAQAAEARISSLEEENKRLSEALEGVMKEETFSLHVGYDNATGGGNFVYADVIRTDSDAFLAARQALEDHNG